MKTHYSLLLLFFCFFVGNTQIINIPDPNFKAKLLEANTVNGIAGDFMAQPIIIDTNNDGEIQLSEAINVGTLNLDSSNISSFEGIQNFSNLNGLRCSDNLITELNLCGTAVYYLFCYDNPNLTTINLKNNVISQTNWGEPPFPPFFAWNIPSLQYVCADAAEMVEAQSYFTTATTNTITFTSDCDSTNCSSLLNTSSQVKDLAFSVFPNPVTDMLHIILNAEIKSISIYNTLGQLVQVDNNDNKTLDVSALKTGSYFIKIVSDKGTSTGKFIKE